MSEPRSPRTARRGTGDGARLTCSRGILYSEEAGRQTNRFSYHAQDNYEVKSLMAGSWLFPDSSECSAEAPQEEGDTFPTGISVGCSGCILLAFLLSDSTTNVQVTTSSTAWTNTTHSLIMLTISLQQFCPPQGPFYWWVAACNIAKKIPLKSDKRQFFYSCSWVKDWHNSTSIFFNIVKSLKHCCLSVKGTVAA